MKKTPVFFLIAVIILVFIKGVYAVIPSGAVPTSINNSTMTPDEPVAVAAIAGNVTEINFHGFSVTQTWQGYFGNITGTIVLADQSKNMMYNWSVTNPRGEIYASTNDTINWQYLQCFNYTADGTYNSSDLSNPGNTSQHGTNLTQLESMFNIPLDAADGVNKTFNLIGETDGHDLFYTNNIEFSQGQCPSTRIFGPDGSQNLREFEQVLLYEPSTASIVFASLLNHNLLGFDNRTHDFQMLVLEDGHGTNIDTTTYYFWMEIE